MAGGPRLHDPAGLDPARAPRRDHRAAAVLSPRHRSRPRPRTARTTAGRPGPRPVLPGPTGWALPGRHAPRPHDLIGTLGPQYQLIDKLTRSATGETRRGLLRVGAAYAALVGWLYQDAGDLSAAAFWRGITQEAALRARDPHLIGYAMVNSAQVRTDLGDGAGVVDLCEAALDEPSAVVPKIHVMAMQQQAHGASLLHDRAEVDRLIGEAERLLPRVDDDLPWGNACRRTPGYLEVQRATCYGRLGLGAEASDLWSQVLAVVPTTARRDRGVYMARHATAAATAREPEQAVEIARDVAVIAVETGSARMRRELATLERAMRPWQDAPVGRDLTEALAPVTEGS
ncbi:Twin-arginine translocation pathway signal [Streptomyces diastatochromogenes]|nr:Twin-arginine translocation pathway signal [Streptomyces diastatochromogenes]